MDQKVQQFLIQHTAFSAVCDSVDIAGVVEKRDDSFKLLSLRITAGHETDSGFAILRLPLERWTVLRNRTNAAWLVDSLNAVAAGGSLRLANDITVEPITAPAGWSLNDFVRQDGGVFGTGRTARTWLGISGDRAFASADDHSAFVSAIRASYAFHDVDHLVGSLHLRQALSSDDSCGIRVEIESPLYYDRAENQAGKVSVYFRKAPRLALAGFRLKWKAAPSGAASTAVSGTAVPVERNGFAVAEIDSSSERIDGTLLFEKYALGTYAFDRKPAPFGPLDAIAVQGEDDDAEEETLEDGPDYAQFDTSRLALRRSAKKQVNRDDAVYEIVKRDIDDAIWCLQRRRYKLAAILAGGVLEAVLQERLRSESDATLRHTFQARFPNKNFQNRDRLTLEQLIGIAARLNRLQNEKLYDGMRDYRNLVHPAVEIREGGVDANAATIVVTAAVMLLRGAS